MSITQTTDEEIPDSLYHYTTLESLAYILRDRTFLFRRLSDLNDPLEGKNDSFEHAEKLVYSSSWTASETDTLPMWKMYAGFDGIRLKFPSDLFASRSEISSGIWPPTTRFLNTTQLETEVKLTLVDERVSQQYEAAFNIISGPDRVEYVSRDEVDKIGKVFYLQQVNDGHEEPVLHLAHVGLTKSNDWSFEQEWRFRIPYTMHMSVVNGSPAHITDMPLPIESQIFVPYDVEKLAALEILTGPKFSEAQKVLLRSLVDTYAPAACIVDSPIKIR